MKGKLFKNDNILADVRLQEVGDLREAVLVVRVLWEANCLGPEVAADCAQRLCARLVVYVPQHVLVAVHAA